MVSEVAVFAEGERDKAGGDRRTSQEEKRLRAVRVFGEAIFGFVVL